MEELNSENVTVFDSKSLNTKIQVSSHVQRNGRRKLEDRFVVESDLNQTFELKLPFKYRYYAIFDGHVTEHAAEYCKDNLHINLIENENFKNGNIKEALKETFIKTDKDFCDKVADQSVKAGTTALVCIIEDDKRLYLAWAGDSSSILIKDGEPIQLTKIHTPDFEEERERIKLLGGECMYTNMWRVMGILAVSRSIGDPDYKPYVTSEPDVLELELNGHEDFCILASDGLWDVLTPEDASTIVYEFLALNAEQIDEKNSNIIDQVSKTLIQRAIDEGSSDNITTIVVFFKDIAKISPSIKQQNGHQNGHNVYVKLNGNGLNQDELNNGFNKGQTNGNGFTMNVNATPFTPDFFNNISMSGIDSIRNLQERALINNVTSNEDNQTEQQFEDNLGAINNNELNYNEDGDEGPHSILPDINAELNKQEDVDLERELDEERVVVNTSAIEIEEVEKAEHVEEATEQAADDDVDEELKDEILTKQEEVEIEESNNKNDNLDNNLKEQVDTVNCEYSVIPTESTASPVDLISESTISDDLTENSKQHEDKAIDIENAERAASPFETLKEDESESTQQNDVVIKVNDQTCEILDDSVTKDETQDNFEVEIESKEEDEEDTHETTLKEEDKVSQANEEKAKESDDTSFEFIEINQTDLIQGLNIDQNQTQYQSPDNSRFSGFNEESVYENANQMFDNSVLNKGVQQQLDNNNDEDEEEDRQNHPFENDSEDSIKFLDKTATEPVLDTSAKENEVDQLAGMIQNTNINGLSEENVDDRVNMNENVEKPLLDYNSADENEEAEEQVPELKPAEVKKSTNLLDSTLMFNSNLPNSMPPTTFVNNNADQQLEDQINENHFNDNENQLNSHASSNFEEIRDEEISPSPNNEQAIGFETLQEPQQKTEELNKTYINREDMDISTQYNLETVINEQVHNENLNSNQLTEPIEPLEEISNEEIVEKEHVDPMVKNLDESNSVYLQANQDPSFLTRRETNKETVEESKDNFEVLESEIEKDKQFDELNQNDLVKDEQSSELKNDLNNVESIKEDQPSVPELDHKAEALIEEEIKPVNKEESVKPEIINETTKLVATGVAATAAAVGIKKASTSKAPATKTTLTSRSTLNKSATSSAKLTKDKSSTTVNKDSKSALTSKPTALKSSLTANRQPLLKKTTSTLTSKPTTSTTARKPLTSSTATAKPLASSRLSTTATRTTATRPATAASRLNKDTTSTTTTTKPLASKVGSTVRSTLTSRLNTASSRPTTIANKPATSSLASKSSTLTNKTAVNKPLPSRPATSKYANVTSKVSASLATTGTKPSSTLNKAPSNLVKEKSSTGLTRKPLTSTLKTATTKSSTTLNNKLSNVQSKVSASLKSTSTATSRLNSKPTTTRQSITKSAASSSPSTVASKKTAVPRKPINKVATSADKSSAVEEQKMPTDSSQLDNLENLTSKSFTNGQVSLTNGDSLNQSLTANLNATTPTSITSSKSRDKLTNSLKAELEAAMELESSSK